MKRKLGVMEKIRRLFTSKQRKFRYIQIERNDDCYCKSGLKYKKCHLPIHEKNNEVPIWVYDTKEDKWDYSVVEDPTRRKRATKSGLRGVDIGLSSSKSVDDIF